MAIDGRSDRPAFDHAPPTRQRGIGPFSFRQAATIGVVVVVVAAVLRIATTPVANLDPGATDFPMPTQFVIGSAVPGLGVGQQAPELLAVTGQNGTTALSDATSRATRSGSPTCAGRRSGSTSGRAGVRRASTRRRLLRAMDEHYRSQGLAVVGIQVQQIQDDAQQYAERYELKYTIGSDVTGGVFHAYRVFALPTQFFIDPQEGSRRSSKVSGL